MIKIFDIYKYPSLYDDQYWWKKDDIEFYKSIIKSGCSALELGSGTGRLALPLLRNNIDYYGLELSKEFCQYANDKLSIYSNFNRITLGDMTNFDLDMKFDYIFIAFNSFLHVLETKDAERCFQSIKKHLNDNGKFILDILVPNPLFLYRPKGHELPVMDFKDSSNGDYVEIYEKNEYNNTTEICDIHWRYQYKNENNPNKQFNYQMRMYYPDIVNRMLIDNGYNIENVFGDYEMSTFSEESHLQIYVSTK